MRRVAILLTLVGLAGSLSCKRYDYEVADAQGVTSGLSKYRSVAIEVGAAPGVESDPADLASFADDIEKYVGATRVIADVRRAPAPAELLLRVQVTKIETKEHFTVQHGTRTRTETEANVDLRDVAQSGSVGTFSVKADPGVRYLPLDGTRRSPVAGAYSNVAHAIAEQIKKRR